MLLLLPDLHRQAYPGLKAPGGVIHGAGDLEKTMTALQSQKFPGSRVRIGLSQALYLKGTQAQVQAGLAQPGGQVGGRHVAHQVAEAVHRDDLPPDGCRPKPRLGEVQGDGIGDPGPEAVQVHPQGQVGRHRREDIPAVEGGRHPGPEIGRVFQGDQGEGRGPAENEVAR
jgi:hypothetical protein